MLRVLLSNIFLKKKMGCSLSVRFLFFLRVGFCFKCRSRMRSRMPSRYFRIRIRINLNPDLHLGCTFGGAWKNILFPYSNSYQMVTQNTLRAENVFLTQFNFTITVELKNVLKRLNYRFHSDRYTSISELPSILIIMIIPVHIPKVARWRPFTPKLT